MNLLIILAAKAYRNETCMSKPADDQFFFGYGKEVYFWRFVVAILIFAIGARMSVYEGVHRLMNPQPLQNVMVNYIVKDDILPDTVEKTVQTSVGEIKKPGRWSKAFLSKVKPAAVRIL